MKLYGKGEFKRLEDIIPYCTQILNALSLSAPLFSLLSGKPYLFLLCFIPSAFFSLHYYNAGAVLNLFVWIFALAFPAIISQSVPAWFLNLFPYWLILSLLFNSSAFLALVFSFRRWCKRLPFDSLHKEVYKGVLHTIRQAEAASPLPSGFSLSKSAVVQDDLIGLLLKEKNLEQYMIEFIRRNVADCENGEVPIRSPSAFNANVIISVMTADILLFEFCDTNNRYGRADGDLGHLKLYVEKCYGNLYRLGLVTKARCVEVSEELDTAIRNTI